MARSRGTREQGTVVNTCQPSTGEWRQIRNQGHPQQHSKFQAILDYVKSCLREMEGKEKRLWGEEIGIEGRNRERYLDLGERTP